MNQGLKPYLMSIASRGDSCEDVGKLTDGLTSPVRRSFQTFCMRLAFGIDTHKRNRAPLQELT